MNHLLDRWNQINKEIRSLKDQLYYLEKMLKKEFIESHKETCTLLSETTLNWREPAIVITTDKKNQPVVELREVDSPTLLNGRNSKVHPAGTTFIVLKSWKTSKNSKRTHFLLYDKKKNRVANYSDNV